MTQHPTELSYQRYDNKGLRYIALRQRIIIVCILIHFCILTAQFLLPEIIRSAPNPQMLQLWSILILGLVVIANMIIALICVFGLAIRFYGVALGIILGIATLIPLFGIIALLIVNNKATKTLRANGVKVGIMGARGKIEE